ncbi:LOG family protein [Streptomycetaceae bacterium NBC_01309]
MGNRARADAHIGPEFRAAIGRWADLGKYLREKNVPAEFHRRVTRQIVMGDVAHRVADGLTSAHELVLVGSGAVHMRAHDPLPSRMNVLAGSLPQSYAIAREADRLGLFVRGISKGRRYSENARKALAKVEGRGLGGLIRYEASRVESSPDGHTVGLLTATPEGRSGVDPFVFEVDFTSPHSMKMLVASNGFQAAAHSYVPVDLPGFPETRFTVPRPEFVLADMLTLMSGLRTPGAAGPQATRLRVEDVPEISQIIFTNRLQGDLLRYAMANNANRMDGGPVAAGRFDVHGRTGERIEGGGGLEFWDAGLRALREAQPQLGHYPSTEPTLEGITAFMRELHVAGVGAEARRGAWYNADGDRVWPVLVPASVRGEVRESHRTHRKSAEPSPEPPPPPAEHRPTADTRLDARSDASRSTPVPVTGSGEGGRSRKFGSLKRRYAALLNAAGDSWYYGKARIEGAWKHGGETRPVVVTYGAVRAAGEKKAYANVEDFNYRMGRAGWIGRSGGDPGIMKAVAEGMLRAEAKSQAVRMKPSWKQPADAAADPAKLVVLGKDVHGALAVPGDVGTWAEATGIIGSSNAEKMDPIPVVFLGRAFWRGSRIQLNTMVESGILDAKIRKKHPVHRLAGQSCEIHRQAARKNYREKPPRFGGNDGTPGTGKTRRRALAAASRRCACSARRIAAGQRPRSQVSARRAVLRTDVVRETQRPAGLPPGGGAEGTSSAACGSGVCLVFADRLTLSAAVHTRRVRLRSGDRSGG